MGILHTAKILYPFQMTVALKEVIGITTNFIAVRQVYCAMFFIKLVIIMGRVAN